MSDTRVYEPEKRTRLGRNRELRLVLSGEYMSLVRLLCLHVATQAGRGCQAIKRRHLATQAHNLMSLDRLTAYPGAQPDGPEVSVPSQTTQLRQS